MRIKVAAVCPESYSRDEEYRNLDRALKYVDEAVLRGADLVCFSKGYPGPCYGPLDGGGCLGQRPLDALRERAWDHGVYICAGEVEPNPDVPDTYFSSAKLISPQGQVIANYRSVQPDCPPLRKIPLSQRRKIHPGDEIPVVETELGKIGLLICGELFVPEIARILMLKGADIILAPTGGINRFTPFSLAKTWRCMAHARASENLVFVVMPHSVFNIGGRVFDFKVGCIASPEEFLALAEGPGIMMATLDMDRLDWLRANYNKGDWLASPADPDNFRPIKTRPGQHLFRRPELYGKIVEPQPDAFDYLRSKEEE